MLLTFRPSDSHPLQVGFARQPQRRVEAGFVFVIRCVLICKHVDSMTKTVPKLFQRRAIDVT